MIDNSELSGAIIVAGVMLAVVVLVYTLGKLLLIRMAHVYRTDQISLEWDERLNFEKAIYRMTTPTAQAGMKKPDDGEEKSF